MSKQETSESMSIKMGELTLTLEVVGVNILTVVPIGTGIVAILVAAALVALEEAVSFVKKVRKPQRDRVERSLVLKLLPIAANLT